MAFHIDCPLSDFVCTSNASPTVDSGAHRRARLFAARASSPCHCIYCCSVFTAVSSVRIVLRISATSLPIKRLPSFSPPRRWFWREHPPREGEFFAAFRFEMHHLHVGSVMVMTLMMCICDHGSRHSLAESTCAQHGQRNWRVSTRRGVMDDDKQAELCLPLLTSMLHRRGSSTPRDGLLTLINDDEHAELCAANSKCTLAVCGSFLRERQPTNVSTVAI